MGSCAGHTREEVENLIKLMLKGQLQDNGLKLDGDACTACFFYLLKALSQHSRVLSSLLERTNFSRCPFFGVSLVNPFPKSFRAQWPK